MGGCGRTGKFWQGCYGCERIAGQNLSRLSPSYTENGVAIITCSMGTWRKVVPSKTPPDSPMDFKCWSGDAWGQLAGSANRAGERKHPLGNVPWLCKDMLPCTPRPTRTICCVHYSGAFLGLPNPWALHLLKRHCQGHPWQGDHSWGNRCFVQTVGRSGTKLQPRTFLRKFVMPSGVWLVIISKPESCRDVLWSGLLPHKTWLSFIWLSFSLGRMLNGSLLGDVVRVTKWVIFINYINQGTFLFIFPPFVLESPAEEDGSLEKVVTNCSMVTSKSLAKNWTFAIFWRWYQLFPSVSLPCRWIPESENTMLVLFWPCHFIPGPIPIPETKESFVKIWSIHDRADCNGHQIL